MSTTDRIERLRARLAEDELDAMLITNPENRRYLSGFTGHDSGADSAGALLVTQDQTLLITDGRYLEQARAEAPGLRIEKRDGHFAPFVAKLIGELGARRVGVEARHLTVATRDDIAGALGAGEGEARAAELISTRDVVEQLRVVKDAEELAAIERAVAITDATFAYISGYLRPGVTEQQVAQEIERYMLEQGAEGLAFDTIVASGPNAALPHARPGQRAIQPGEPITIDMGARYDGYCSDMTRTVILGAPDELAQSVYDAVLRAQLACEHGLRAGMNGKQADALARDALDEQGYGENYLHSTGHGLGLEIHENPRLSRFGEESVLPAGAVVTVEPGVYISGWGGVRIEDTVVMTDGGVRVLTRASKDFELPLTTR